MAGRAEDDATSAASSEFPIPEEPFDLAIGCAVSATGISFLVALSFTISIMWGYSGALPDGWGALTLLGLLVIWTATLASLILRVPVSRPRRLLSYLALWAGLVLLLIYGSS